jgi:hypothetical protein
VDALLGFHGSTFSEGKKSIWYLRVFWRRQRRIGRLECDDVQSCKNALTFRRTEYGSISVLLYIGSSNGGAWHHIPAHGNIHFFFYLTRPRFMP